MILAVQLNARQLLFNQYTVVHSRPSLLNMTPGATLQIELAIGIILDFFLNSGWSFWGIKSLKKYIKIELKNKQ